MRGWERTFRPMTPRQAMDGIAVAILHALLALDDMRVGLVETENGCKLYIT